jgi:AraC-like DNA-binding protein
MEQYEKMYLYRRIVKAKLFIDSNYSDPLDLDNISDQAYFSKYHFIRLFKSVYGKTPSHYLLQVRMDNAKTLLTKGQSVLAVSMSVGFDSPTSFAGAFKKIVGVAPSVYRRKQETKRNAIKENPLLYVPHCFVETHGLTK